MTHTTGRPPRVGRSGVQRAWAARAQAVGITCHSSSSSPIEKSPYSSWLRRGSGSPWSTDR